MEGIIFSLNNEITSLTCSLFLYTFYLISSIIIKSEKLIIEEKYLIYKVVK